MIKNPSFITHEFRRTHEFEKEYRLIAKQRLNGFNSLIATESKWSSNGEKVNTMEKRKFWKMDHGIDLNLSLSTKLGEEEVIEKGTTHWDEQEEEVDSTLSLSLFSSSKKAKYSIDLNSPL